MPETKPFSMRRLFALLKDQKGKVVFLVLLVIVSQGANIAVPFIIKTLIDALTGFIKNGGALPWHTLGYSAAGILFCNGRKQYFAVELQLPSL